MLNPKERPDKPPRAKPPSLLDAALTYARQGIPVHPLRPRGKEPITPNGFKDASTDEATIRAWWKRTPQANIGVPTGEASGWAVLDFDPRNGGDADGVVPDRPALPATRAARSGSGGLHRVFQHHAGLTCKQSLYAGVDLKADGGYIVVAPSLHPGGGRYEWLNTDELAPLPEWVIADRGAQSPQEAPDWRASYTAPAQGAQGARQATQEDAQKWITDALAKAASEGSRNRAGFWLAMQLLDNGIPDPEAAILEYAAQCPDKPGDPYTAREAWRSLASAARYPRREPARSQKPLRFTARQGGKRRQERDDTGGASGYDADTGRPDDTFLLQYAADDNGNAEAMRALHGHEYLYVQEYGWLKWTGTHWERIPEEIAAKDAIAVLKRRRIAAVLANHEPLVRATKADNQRVNGCLALFRAHMAGPKVDDFDADLDALNCQNGVFNLKTGVLTPHDSSQRFTYCLPVDYNPNADKTSIEEFVFDCTGRNRNVAEYLQTCAGYSLTGHTREEEFFYIYGPTRSGKGTFCETFGALLGRPLSVEVDFNTFTAKRDADNQNFDLASLKPARMVFASESNKYQSFNPGKMKQITGGNMVRCAFKGKDMFEYRPQFKVWLSSNHPINADVEDDAFWESRAHVIEFPHSRLGAEDKTLKERLRTTASLEGVLRWAIEGARRWYADGTLKTPEEVTRATRGQRAQLDYIGQWISDCCTLAADAWESSAKLMESYKAWCEENGHKSQDSKGLSETLIKRFACVAYRQPNGGARGFNGIRLGANPNVTPDDDFSFQVVHPANAELFSADDSFTPSPVPPVPSEMVVEPRAREKIEKGENQAVQVVQALSETMATLNYSAFAGVPPENLICPRCGGSDIRDYSGDLRCYVCDEPVTRQDGGHI